MSSHHGWLAPYLLPEGQDNLPDGEFLLPVCTTRERLTKTLNALNAMIVLGNLQDIDHVIDIYRALAHINHPENAPCVSLKGKCLDYATFSKVITWLPNDPYENPGGVPPGYITTPWYIANDVTAATLGAPVGSVVTDALHFPSNSLLNGYPRFRINVEGTGRMEIHLASINAGGFAQVTTDDDILSTTFVDLNKDIIHAPPETENKISITREFDTPGAHNVEVIMIPNVGTTFPFVLGGGAVTGVTLCGFNVQPVENETMFRQKPTDPCVLQQSDDGFVWTDVFDFSLCPSIATGDDVDALQEEQRQLRNQTALANYNTYITNVQQIQDGYTSDYTGTPSSVNPDAPDDNFAGDSSDERLQALCGALNAFVLDFAARLVQQYDIWFAANTIGYGILQVTGIAWAANTVLGIDIRDVRNTASLTYEQMRTALTDELALDRVACCMRAKLEPLPITEANWLTALDSCAFTAGSNEAIVSNFLSQAIDENYLTFVDLLGTAYQSVNDGLPVECPCGLQDCDELTTAMNDKTFVPSAAKPFGYVRWDGSAFVGDYTAQTGGEYLTTGGYLAGGSLHSTLIHDTGFAVNAIRDLGAEYTITGVSWRGKRGGTLTSASEVIGFLDGAGGVISATDMGTTDPDYGLRSWSTPVAGCRYVVITVFHDGGDAWLDDICIDYQV